MWQVSARNAHASLLEAWRVLVSSTGISLFSLVGRAPAQQAGGHGFESHRRLIHAAFALEALSDTQRRAVWQPLTGLAHELLGCVLLQSGVAQWLACWAHNPKVRGSKPRSAILDWCPRLGAQRIPPCVATFHAKCEFFRNFAQCAT